MNVYSRKSRKNIKSFKDYMIPITIVAIIVILFFYQVIFKKTNTSEEKTNPVTANELYIEDTKNTQASIEYPWGKEISIQGNQAQIYPWEKLKVGAWSVEITSKNNKTKLKLNQLWELKYNSQNSYSLISSEIWGETEEIIEIAMRYAKITTSPGTIFWWIQNEVASTIYVLKGNVDIENLAWKRTTVSQWNKITIMRDIAKDSTINIALLVDAIDENITLSDWFIKNQGQSILEKQKHLTLSNTGMTGNTITGTALQTGAKQPIYTWWVFSYITITSHQDEWEVQTNSITIEGTINDTSISRIEFSGIPADINTEKLTFIAKNVPTDKTVNDIVYKVYDLTPKIVEKKILTIYNTQANKKTSSTKPTVENYSLETSTGGFKILFPKENPYTTTENKVKIEGMVPANKVKRIVVNGFQLQKFPAYGSYWVYFANTDFQNLKPGVNIYKIEYYDANDTLIHESNVVIVQESKETQTGSNN